MKIIDKDLHCGAQCFGWSGGCTPSELSTELNRLKIQTGLSSNLENLFSRDNIYSNSRFLEKVKPHHPVIRPFLAVNPSVPSWREALKIFQGKYCGLKLFHRFHGYSLLDPSIEEFFSAAEKMSMPVVAGLRLFEERTQPFILKQLPEPDAGQMKEIAGRHQDISFIFSGASGAETDELLASGKDNVYVTIPFVEGEKMLAGFGDSEAEKIIFGSNFPFFYIEAALAKVQYMGCSSVSRELVLSGNAGKLFKL